ncbi:septation ring formation regulator EzrA [Spiroplasma endosymbiont of Amphibalanus improvisus]|uniref:septation ring formation regulator EzrA n=1 Tax=Spiroplasma endosymbiont of Amphibalanus improvisus TaxID=3066327 RepID=UPI00313C6E7D
MVFINCLFSKGLILSGDLFSYIFLGIAGLGIIFLFVINVQISVWKAAFIDLQKSLEIIKILDKLPLKQKLLRIEQNTWVHKEVENDLLILRTQYEIFYEKKLFDILDSLNSLFKEESIEIGIKWNRKNRYKIKLIREQLQIIYKEIKEFENNLNILLGKEKIQREYILMHKSLFHELNKDYKKLQLNFETGRQNMEKFIGQIKELFNDFEEQLNECKFEKLSQTTNNITNVLNIYTELLQAFPQIMMVISKVVPKKMTNLKNKYILFNDDKDYKPTLKLNLKELEDFVEEEKEIIKEKMENIQYKTALKHTWVLLSTIDNFDKSINNKKKMVQSFKAFFLVTENYVETIVEKFKYADFELNTLSSISELNREELDTYQLSKQIFQKITKTWSVLMKNVKYQIKKGNYKSISQETDSLLQICLKAQYLIQSLDGIIKNQSKKSNIIKESAHKVELVLVQIESRLSQILNEGTVAKYAKQIASSREDLEVFKKLNLDKNNDKDKKKILEKLYSLKNSIIILYYKISDEFIIFSLAQEAILYVRKYLLNSGTVEDRIEEIENSFGEGNSLESLEQSIKLMYEKENIESEI